MAGFLQTRGYWDQGLVLHQAALAAARQAGDRPGQARALMLLSPMQTMTEDNPAAAASATRALQLYRDLGDRAGQADALAMIGFLHTVTDDYPAAAAELRQALELFRDLGHRRGQGDALTPGHRAPLYRGLPGRRRLPPAGAGALPRHSATGPARPTPSWTWVPCSG